MIHSAKKNHRRRRLLRALASIAIAAVLGACGGPSGGAPAGAEGPAPSSSAAAAQEGPGSAIAASGAESPGQAQTQPSGAAQPGAAEPGASQAGAASATAPSLAAGDPAGAPDAGASQPASPGVSPAARKLGEVVYAEGEVTVHRAGGSKERIDIGDVVRQYDVLATGPSSRATIDLAAGYPGGAELKLAENTAFYFDTKQLSADERKTVIQLLAGALAIKVDKLANGSFNVAADGAVLGVRGTVFIVDTIPDGSLLVTTNEGAVAVKSNDGGSAVSRSDKAVAVSAEASLDTLAIEPANAAAFRSGWREDAISAFKGQALNYSSAYAKAIEDNSPAFDAAYAKLKGQDAVLKTWKDARLAGKAPRFSDWTAEKKVLAAVLFDCLKSLFLIERPYYRLIELKAYHDAGTGVGTLKDGRSSAAFFRGFEADTRGLAMGMAAVREALELFNWASAGSPLGEFFGTKAATLGSGGLLLGLDDW
jgi:ferric-dicitrate binding protein FerR (iron transport regulator)